MAKITVQGIVYSAELSRDPAVAKTSVAIYADDVWAGNGYLSDKLVIEDCDADLGEEVYGALEDAIAADFACGVGAGFDPTAR